MMYLLILILQRDITLSTKVSMLQYPNTIQDSSDSIHSLRNTDRIVTGMLATATNKSAVVNPRIKTFVTFLKFLFLQIIIHIHIFPMNAHAHTRVKKIPSKYIGLITMFYNVVTEPSICKWLIDANILFYQLSFPKRV